MEFGLPDLAGRTHILKIHSKTMAIDRDIRYEVAGAAAARESEGVMMRRGRSRDRLSLPNQRRERDWLACVQIVASLPNQRRSREREDKREGEGGRERGGGDNTHRDARVRCGGARYELLARLCPNTTGAELRSVCTEAGMFAIRSRRKSISEKDMLDAVQKVIKG